MIAQLWSRPERDSFATRSRDEGGSEVLSFNSREKTCNKTRCRKEKEKQANEIPATTIKSKEWRQLRKKVGKIQNFLSI